MVVISLNNYYVTVQPSSVSVQKGVAMFTQSIRLGRILGIPIGVNYSWLVVFVLITMSLSAYFAQIHPEWSATEHLLIGVATSVLFFASVLLHELGHSVVALHYDIPVRSITLFIFGGVAQITREPQKPVHEFNIAIAGPIVSALVGGLFLGVMMLARGSAEGIASLGEWLGRINIILAVFNLLPGFPLDGGRILRSIVWKFTNSFERATAVAAGAGQFFAYAFILVGVWQALFAGNLFGGLWIGFIGWFLLNAAQSSVVQMQFRRALRGITARDVMTKECIRSNGSESIANLVEHHFLRGGSRCSMVMDDGRFRGIVTLHEVKKVPRDEWAATPIQSVMVPEEKLSEVTPDTPIDVVLQKMNDDNVSQIPVVENGTLLGVIGRDRLLALVQTHMELKS
jgi:Zn-dependent protease/predicted transcriptional regulator